MPVRLEGGCLVSQLREPASHADGAARVWPQFDRTNGTEAITLRVLEIPPGNSVDFFNEVSEEVLFVISGAARVNAGGRSHEAPADTGIFVRPGDSLTVAAEGSDAAVLLSSRCPDPGRPADPSPVAPAEDRTARPPVVRLRDRPRKTTADRWYCELIDKSVGSLRVTQFVGAIPPGRAPDHFHHYEEVICILAGEGKMWAGETNTPIEPGSCIFLPKKQIHCVENTGDGEMRLLGVFHPSGSPAVRYDAP